MIAIVSDVHSNLAALEAVLEDIQSLNIREIVSLGDIVGYGPDPEACVDLLRGARISTMGNHEEAVLTGDASDFNIRARRAAEWTRKQFRQGIESDPRKMERWNVLERLVRTHEEEGVLYLHASPSQPTREYIVPRDARNTQKMKRIFSQIDSVCFGGHTHLPGVFTQGNEFFSPAQLHNLFMIDKAQKVMINVGSVGQPRDGDTTACYVTFDGETVVWRRVKYDVQKTIRKIYEIEDLDNYLGDRLKVGK